MILIFQVFYVGLVGYLLRHFWNSSRLLKIFIVLERARERVLTEHGTLHFAFGPRHYSNIGNILFYFPCHIVTIQIDGSQEIPCQTANSQRHH